MPRIVKQRRVFYLSGFDPRGVAAYHRLFTEESQKQVQLMDWRLKSGPRKRKSTLSSEWHAERKDGETTVNTTFEFLHWDDIVRQHWHAGFVRLYALALKTYWHGFFTTGILWKLFRVAKWPFVTGVAPAIVFFLLPLLALAAGWNTYVALSSKLLWSSWAAITSGAAVFLAICGLGLWLERELNLGWLLRSYAFTLEYGRGKVAALDDRIRQFSERIAAYLASSNDDEVLIVGHSWGANMAISVLARMLQKNPSLGKRMSHCALLTLGGSIPMQGLMPWASDFRSELVFMNQFERLAWIDISAEEDLASFAALNPVHASGVPQESAPAERPRVVAGEFKDILTPETYATASWDLFRMHFQYLMAYEIPRDNDYFSITTDSRAFTERFDLPTTG